jgi:hypothetical protein
MDLHIVYKLVTHVCGPCLIFFWNMPGPGFITKISQNKLGRNQARFIYSAYQRFFAILVLLYLIVKSIGAWFHDPRTGPSATPFRRTENTVKTSWISYLCLELMNDYRSETHLLNRNSSIPFLPLLLPQPLDLYPVAGAWTISYTHQFMPTGI